MTIVRKYPFTITNPGNRPTYMGGPPALASVTPVLRFSAINTAGDGAALQKVPNYGSLGGSFTAKGPASSPTKHVSGAQQWLSFDGVDDLLTATTALTGFTGTDPALFWAVAKTDTQNSDYSGPLVANSSDTRWGFLGWKGGAARELCAWRGGSVQVSTIAMSLGQWAIILTQYRPDGTAIVQRGLNASQTLTGVGTNAVSGVPQIGWKNPTTNGAFASTQIDIMEAGIAKIDADATTRTGLINELSTIYGVSAT
ncbi:hypothetical protein [Arthrobacter sp. NPDC090010]|uniref:hypothetical protein n=1 Tax=Arthrobacter sp. NPDC090010 TaxID=3363942 RepID=UPI00381C96BD